MGSHQDALGHLLSAIEKKDVESVRVILSKNPEIVKPFVDKNPEIVKPFVDHNVDCRYPRTPLSKAVYSEHEEIVKLLIQYGADVRERLAYKKKDSTGSVTLLHLLAGSKDDSISKVKIAEILVGNGADVNAQSVKTRTSLQMAVKSGNTIFAEFLLKNNARLVEGPEWIEIRPVNLVWRAPRSKQSEMMQLLLKYGLDITARSPKGCDYMQSTIAAVKQLNLDVDVVGIIKVLLNSGLSANSVDDSGVTTLMYAIRLKNLDLISLLVEKGADVNLKLQNYGTFPLYIAVQHKSKDIVDFLLSNGAEINAKNNNEWTALHLACYINNRAIIVLLLERGATVNIKTMDGGFTPVYLASKYGDVETLNLLLKKGPEVDVRTEKGWSALDVACHHGKSKVIEALLNAGAAINVKSTSCGIFPLYNAAYFNNSSDIIELLLSKGAEVDAKSDNGLTALHAACSRGHDNVIKVLVNAGANVSIKSTKGNVTPLHLAVQSNNKEEIIGLLLSTGVNINIETENGWTALHVACRQGNEALVNFLIEAGASIHRVTVQEGYSTLHLAAISSNGENIIDSLLSKGLEIDVKDNEGCTALNIACKYGNEKVIQVLVRAGADVNTKSKDGSFPLHSATNLNKVILIGYLLSNGAELNAQDECGNTALHLACRNQCTKAITILLEKGADISVENKHGLTPPASLIMQYQVSNNSSIRTMLTEIAKKRIFNNLVVHKKDMNLIRAHPQVLKFFQKKLEEFLQVKIKEAYKPYLLDLSFARFLLSRRINPFY